MQFEFSTKFPKKDESSSFASTVVHLNQNRFEFILFVASSISLSVVLMTAPILQIFLSWTRYHGVQITATAARKVCHVIFRENKQNSNLSSSFVFDACSHKEKLEEKVKLRTQELQVALEVKSRFLAIMSHGNWFISLFFVFLFFFCMHLLHYGHRAWIVFFGFCLFVSLTTKFLAEIRTPMSGIMGSLQLLSQTKLNAEQQVTTVISADKVSSVS